jgi:hypothetical protein
MVDVIYYAEGEAEALAAVQAARDAVVETAKVLVGRRFAVGPRLDLAGAVRNLAKAEAALKEVEHDR